MTRGLLACVGLSTVAVMPLSAQPILPPEPLEYLPAERREENFRGDLNRHRYAESFARITREYDILLADYSLYFSELSLPGSESFAELLSAARHMLGADIFTSSEGTIAKLSAIREEVSARGRRPNQSEKELRLIGSLVREMDFLNGSLKRLVSAESPYAQASASHGRAVENLALRQAALAMNVGEIDARRQEISRLLAVIAPQEPIAVAIAPGGLLTPGPAHRPEPTAPVAAEKLRTLLVLRDSLIALRGESGESAASAAPKQRVFVSSEGKGSIIREFRDSIRVGKSQQPIRISSDLGNVMVTGWTRRLVAVTARSEVSSSHAQITNLAGQGARVTLSAEADAITVHSELPLLDDPSVQVVSNSLEVMVPADHPIAVAGNFGEIIVASITQSTSVNGNNAHVTARDLSGAVSLTTNQGNITGSELGGAISISVLNGEITVSKSGGEITIECEHGGVSLSSNRGSLFIQAGGPVTVETHSGPLAVETEHGGITVRQVDGNTRLISSYAPIVVEDISGKLDVSSTRGSVKLADITDDINADLVDAALTASGIRGGLVLTLVNCRSDLSFADTYAGKSQIDVSSGSLQILLPVGSNILLDAVSHGGTIRGNAAIQRTATENEERAQVKSGAGTQRVTIAAERANLVVNVR